MKIRVTFTYEWQIEDLNSYVEDGTKKDVIEVTKEQLDDGSLLPEDLEIFCLPTIKVEEIKD